MQIFVDKELGKIVLKPHKRARRIIARKKHGCIELTVPFMFNTRNLPNVLDNLKPRLLRLKPIAARPIAEGDEIQSFSFRARFVRERFADHVRLSLKNGELVVFVPSDADFSSPALQKNIKEAVIHALRLEAKRILPAKTADFAQKHGLTFETVKINKSKSRWGSCSAKKNINFSLFLMLMPEKFIDYVVLHELAHTVEMNHGAAFWQLLSALCGSDAKALSRQMKAHKTESYALLTE